MPAWLLIRDSTRAAVSRAFSGGMGTWLRLLGPTTPAQLGTFFSGGVADYPNELPLVAASARMLAPASYAASWITTQDC